MVDQTINENTISPADSLSASQQLSKLRDPSELLKEAEAALAEAEASLRGPQPAPFTFSELTPQDAIPDTCSMNLLGDVQLDLKIELGRTQMHLEEILKLRKGAVVTLDRMTNDLVDVYANGRMIARGEVLVLNGSYCIRVTELIGTEAASAAKVEDSNP
jgi:flagellar motor switch protein FliN